MDVVARSRSVSVERRAVFAVAIAIVLWSASSLFVRAGHSDALVFTTWRLWFALPPPALIVALRFRRSCPVRRAPLRGADPLPRSRLRPSVVGGSVLSARAA